MEVPGKYVVIDGNREPKPPNVFPWGNPTQQIRAPGFPRAELFLPHEMIHSNLIPSPTFGPPRSSLSPLPLPRNPVVQNNLVTEMVRQQHEANYRRVLMSCHAALPANHLPCPNHAATSNCVHNYSHTGMNLAPFTLFPMWFSTYPRTEFMPQGNWYTCPCSTSSYWFAMGAPAKTFDSRMNVAQSMTGAYVPPSFQVNPTTFDSRMNAAPSTAGANYVPPSFHANPMSVARLNGSNSNVRYYEVKKSTGTSRNLLVKDTAKGSATKKAKESTKEETKKAESTCRMTNKVEIEGEKGIPREVKVSSSVKEISSPSAVEKEGDEETTKEGFVLLDSNAVHEES